MEERRFNRRFNLQLTCLLCRSNGDASAPRELVTDNISSGGAYFYTSSPYPVGTRLNIQVMVRRLGNLDANANGSYISICGEVHRTDAVGMAVEFDDQYHIFQVGAESCRKHAGGAALASGSRKQAFAEAAAMEE